MKKHDLPSMPFYVGDWMKCPEVRSCSLAERGLWFDMLCLMWESTERGVLVNPGGTPYTPKEISRIVGETEDLVIQMLNQMATKHIYSRRDSDGAIYCRRMVRDEEIRKIRRKSGVLGGNPLLVKQKGYPNCNQNTEDEDETAHSSSFSQSSEGGGGGKPGGPDPIFPAWMLPDLLIGTDLERPWRTYVLMRNSGRKPLNKPELIDLQYRELLRVAKTMEDQVLSVEQATTNQTPYFKPPIRYDAPAAEQRAPTTAELDKWAAKEAAKYGKRED